MADQYVQVNSGTGPKIDVSELTVNGQTVERQRLAIGDATTPGNFAKVNSGGDQLVSLCNPTGAVAGFYAKIGATGSLSVSADPITLFNDPFDGNSFDTTNRWTTGGTVPPSCATGIATILAGASTSASSSLVSQPTFPAPGTSFKVFGCIAKFESIGSPVGAAGYLNSHRFIGCGTVPTTWTATYSGSSSSGPLLDAFGFEIDTDGKMYPVVYSNGVRTRPALLFGGSDIATGNGTGTGTTLGGLKSIFDGQNHLFAISSRADSVLFLVDNIDMPIAVFSATASGWSAPNTQNLPVRFHSINSGSAPSGTMVFSTGAVAVGDTGTNASQLSDGTYPWRKATISAAGALKTDNSGVTQPISCADTSATGTISAVNANLASGVATTNSTVSAGPLAGEGSAAVQVVGAMSATLTPQASVDGSNWVTLASTSLVNVNTGAYAGTITAAGLFQVDVTGFQLFRITCSAYTSGSPVVSIRVCNSSSGLVALDNPIPAGANLIGGVNVSQIGGSSVVTAATGVQKVGIIGNANATLDATIGTATPTNAVAVTLAPNTAAAAGLSFYSGSIGATATTVKASAGAMYGYDYFNNNTVNAYVQIFNKLIGSVTLGTTVPDIVHVIPAGGGRVVSLAAGVTFGTGISFAVTTTRTGLTALTNPCDINFYYK